jgi:predicted nucleic acid-binding protein
MGRVLLDTNVFAYAMGGPSPYREPCQGIIELLATGAIEGEVSTDLVQEFLHLRFRRTRDRHAAAEAARHIAMLVALHDVTASELTRALALFQRHEHLGARDAIFAAIALNRRLDAILTADRGFDGIPGLTRVDPLDAAAVERLCG